MSGNVLHLDFETYSTVDLREVGVHRYAEEPYTGIWLFSYRFDKGPVGRWLPGQPIPQEVRDHIAEGRWVAAHGGMFERTIWNRVLPSYAPGAPRIEAWHQTCTMARASEIGLPADLDRLGQVLDVAHLKDNEGAALMKRMARPKGWEGKTPIFESDPAKLQRLYKYCDDDVYSESDIDEAVPWLEESERQLWILDQTINDRGIAVDVQLCLRASELTVYAKRQADYRMAMLTGGMVPKVTNNAKLVEWLNAVGVPCSHLRKGDQDDVILTADLLDNPTAIEAIELRRTAGKTSVAKYDKILECVCNDGRLYGLLFFYGARTGRWAGRLVQPQNYPRVNDDHGEVDLVEFVVKLLLSDMPISEVYELIELLGPPRSPTGDKLNGVASLAWLSKALRSTFVSAPGRKFVGGDFSNIEGRITAWLSNEAWKLDAFLAYDLGIGPDLYKLTYANSFGVKVEQVTKPLRQIGKVQELALGYQGGIGAYFTMTHTYMVKLHMIVDAVRKAVSPEEWDTQMRFYDGARDKTVFAKGLGEKRFNPVEWTALKIVVNKWRAAHPGIVAGWRELQDASIQAIDYPGQIVPVYGGRVRYMCNGEYLFCSLPNGDIMSYAQPYVKREEKYMIFDGIQWVDCEEIGDEMVRYLVEQAGATPRLVVRHTAYFMGISSETKQWRSIALYGGYQCENIVQATARGVMKAAMFRVEEAGYPLVLTVHDELLAEPLENFGSVREFERLMSVTEDWMDGLPIAAAAWEDKRYVK